MSMIPAVSVVVPLYDEEDSVAALVEKVRLALGSGQMWELLLVDDGSRDGTTDVAAQVAAADRRVRVVQLARNYGQSAAMQAGFDQARGEVVVSMDGDLQNDPADIPQLVDKLNEGYDLVAGYRVRRRDRLITRKVPSWIANQLIHWITGVPIRDNGCSLKAYSRGVLDRMRLYSDMHRFIPGLAAALAGARIAEIPVRHHARRFGRSKYGLSRVGKVLVDLLTIATIRSFRQRPLLMFAAVAAASAVVGLAFAVAAAVAFMLFRPEKAHALVLPGAALLCFGLAGYLMMLGLISQVAVHEAEEEERQPLPVVHEVQL
jgi:glycosyltransferase involved in cell wall biosynthesis